MASKKTEPLRRYMSFSFAHKKFYVCHGEPFIAEPPPADLALAIGLPLQRFDFSSAQWSDVSPVSVDQEPEERDFWRKRTNHVGVCCAVLGNCAYTFGGMWKYGYAVHELNLDTMVWRRLEPRIREDGPMDKIHAGMVVCGDETLCVFGGYGHDTGRHQPGATYYSDGAICYTNELHVFHTKKG